MKKDLYDKLGVKPDATPDQIKKAFRKKARQLHPDHNPNDPKKEQEFKEVAIAYDILSDPTRRQWYNETGDENSADTTKQEAMNLFLEIVITNIMKKNKSIFISDFFKEIREAFKVSAKDYVKHIKAIKQTVKHLEKVLERVIHKDGENSFIHVAINNEMHKALADANKLKQKIRVVNKAYKIAKEYNFKRDIPTQADIADVFSMVAGYRGYKTRTGGW